MDDARAMKRSRAVAKLAWKALKNDPESSKAAVSAAKAAYKRLKRTPANVVQRDWPLTTAAAFSDAAIDASFEGSLLLKTKARGAPCSGAASLREACESDGVA